MYVVSTHVFEFQNRVRHKLESRRFEFEGRGKVSDDDIFDDNSLRVANSDIMDDVTVAVFHLVESLREEVDTAVVESSPTAIER